MQAYYDFVFSKIYEFGIRKLFPMIIDVGTLGDRYELNSKPMLLVGIFLEILSSTIAVSHRAWTSWYLLLELRFLKNQLLFQQ